MLALRPELHNGWGEAFEAGDLLLTKHQLAMKVIPLWRKAHPGGAFVSSAGLQSALAEFVTTCPRQRGGEVRLRGKPVKQGA
eukprot:2963303-Alexandrium_andersonii.AAC.1